MKPLSKIPTPDAKIPLRKYHLSLPEEARGSSVKAIADACHVTPAIVYGWIRGKRIREIYKEKIAEVTGISIKKLQKC